MSKVYSFRLNDDNPREAQAREVIDAWVEEGYSLRYVIVEALLTYKKERVELDELSLILEQLNGFILSLEKQPTSNPSGITLSNSFLDAMKQSSRLGLTSD
jgi:hypothetical protein